MDDSLCGKGQPIQHCRAIILQLKKNSKKKKKKRMKGDDAKWVQSHRNKGRLFPYRRACLSLTMPLEISKEWSMRKDYGK